MSHSRNAVAGQGKVNEGRRGVGMENHVADAGQSDRVSDIMLAIDQCAKR